MTRRRADTVSPYPGQHADTLTPAQRVEAQEAILERWGGRLDRTEWGAQFWRGREGAVYARPRYATTRTGSQRGSREQHR